MTAQFTFALPNDLADKLRARVSSGDYASESDVVADALRQMEAERDDELEEWLRTEAVTAYDRARANPDSLLSAKEVLSSLDREYERLSKPEAA